MGERDEFDKIVEHLDLDLGFLDDQRAVEPEPDVRTPTPARETPSPDLDEEFYRRVEPRPRRPWRRDTTLAWIGILGSPAALVLCTVIGVIAPRSIVVALALVFVASSVYLISQLPDRDNGDDPDDGAVI